MDDNHGLENSLKKKLKPLNLQCLDVMPGGKVCDNHVFENSQKRNYETS